MADTSGMRCDATTLTTLREMELKEIDAHKAQDYELLKSLSKDLIIVRSVSQIFLRDNFLLDWCLNP